MGWPSWCIINVYRMSYRLSLVKGRDLLLWRSDSLNASRLRKKWRHLVGDIPSLFSCMKIVLIVFHLFEICAGVYLTILQHKFRTSSGDKPLSETMLVLFLTHICLISLYYSKRVYLERLNYCLTILLTQKLYKNSRINLMRRNKNNSSISSFAQGIGNAEFKAKGSCTWTNDQ